MPRSPEPSMLCIIIACLPVTAVALGFLGQLEDVA